MTMIPILPEVVSAVHDAALQCGLSDQQFFLDAVQEKLGRIQSNSLAARRAALFGSQKGQIWMSEDFDGSEASGPRL